MKITETNLDGCLIIEPIVHKDARGFFFESFNKKVFEKLTNQSIDFVQDNISNSSFGVLRGLHFQRNPHSQAKLVQVLSGSVLDVAVDLRKSSNTFGQHFKVELTSQNKRQLFIPRGFAHGFVVLSEKAKFFYKCDNYYSSHSELGIRFDDPMLDIDWQLSTDEIEVSDKDQKLFKLEDLSSLI